jgi:hypothetical protein
VATGNKLWDTSPPADYPWGNFWAYDNPAAYGMIYGLGYSGVYAWNVTNGKEVWHFKDRPTEMETPYGTWPFGSSNAVVGGGIIYAPNTEHSPTLPYLRGWKLHALDAFTGEEIWNIRGFWATIGAIAEGTLFATNYEDGYQYAFSKGNTATTVSASEEVIAQSSSIMLKGAVLDMSPAQNGTAAVSDASMSSWMEYLHMQQPYPLNATGVDVSLDAVDPNNNFVHIGTATSDLTGKYSFLWKPEIEGKYTIVASFLGSESYYSSTAETSIGVTAAPPTPTPPPEPQPAPDYTLPIVGTGIAMILAVAIATILLLRKRP